MSKYGNVSVPIPSTLLAEKDVLKDLLEKEEITKEYYNSQMRELNYKVGMYIAGTNGRYTRGKPSSKHRIKNMDEGRARHTEDVMENLRQEIVAEAEAYVEPTSKEELTIEEQMEIVQNSK